MLTTFISFWFRKSKKKWAILFSPLTLTVLLIILAIITLIIYLSYSQPSWWVIKTCISSFVGVIIFILYFFTMIDDDIRENIKDWLGEKIVFPFLMTIIQPLLWISNINFPFNISSKKSNHGKINRVH
jgi:hypothetical protein